MKPSSLLLALFVFTVSVALAKDESFKIQVKGKVDCITSSMGIPAKVSILANGLNLAIETDNEGKFATTFTAVPTFTVTVRAAGYEELEQTLSVKNLKSDSVIQISASLIPVEKTKLSGMVFDKKTSKPIRAELDLYLDNDVVKQDVEVIEGGKYGESLLDFGWYIIEISAKGYLNLSDTVWVMNCNRPVLHRDYYLTPIEAGLVVRLKNIQFNFGKTTLHTDSYDELKDVAEWLQKNPSLKLEIGGHTDSDGPDDYNLWLSQARAQAVVDYVISQGASKEQLVAKGYGETKPVAEGESMQAKSTNRRVEFTILEN
ncbi:MAG TPA: OmpA family protein [Cyclobacteriaceae bacterium]|jgi:outer membrane protein OmpA-like peptidoglycan-associated protein|nr:OmpA family protein [Cyclobacteriaceae bacterium]